MTSGEHEANLASSFWLRLLHRWFIEFNPLYLLSAALVLGGAHLMSVGMTRSGSLDGQVGVAAVAEVYAWALIGGAALLTRIRLRRPAVLLALLAALYQGDVTLHTETCVYFGVLGLSASVTWLVSFVSKLYALAWALRVKLSRSAIAVPTFGALGLALLPAYLRSADVQVGTVIVAGWLFALFASGLWSSREVESAVALDVWGQTVLRRALKAIWSLWATLCLGHVLFWSSEYGLDLRALWPVAVLLSTRWLGRESGVWLVAAAMLLFVGRMMPSLFSMTALLCAAAFCLRALRQPTLAASTETPSRATTAYRTAGFAGFDATAHSRPVASVSFGLASRAAIPRLCTGALFCTYLSIWTASWAGGPWPEHPLALDLALAALVFLLAWKARARAALVGLGATCLHFGFQRGLIPGPATLSHWGMLFVAIGFGLLVTSLGVSWRLRPTRDADP